jgi:hypothetical protein
VPVLVTREAAVSHDLATFTDSDRLRVISPDRPQVDVPPACVQTYACHVSPRRESPVTIPLEFTPFAYVCLPPRSPTSTAPPSAVHENPRIPWPYE